MLNLYRFNNQFLMNAAVMGALILTGTACRPSLTNELTITAPSVAVTSLPDFKKVSFPRVSQEPVEHNVMIYTAANDDLGDSAYNDFIKLRDSDIGSDTVVHHLLSSSTKGAYSIRIHGSDHDQKVRQVQIDRPDMNSLENLKSFIKQSIQDTPAERHSLILQGHGWSFIFKGESKQHREMSISQVRQVLEELGVKLFFIGLDACLMSSIETHYELRNVAEYVIAAEDYAPWDGIVSKEMLRHFDNITDPRELLTEVARSSAVQNEDIEDMSDITVVSTRHISHLVKQVKALKLTEADFLDDQLVDENDKDYAYDLYELVMTSSRFDQNQKLSFESTFNKAVVFYQANKSRLNTGRLTHGISILKTRNYKGFNDQERMWFDELQFNRL